MPAIAMFVRIDEEHVIEGLRDAQARLNGSSEAVLDFASVSRVQPRDLAALEELVRVAENRGVKIELHGVNVTVYKVLKLAKLASRFGFHA